MLPVAHGCPQSKHHQPVWASLSAAPTLQCVVLTGSPMLEAMTTVKAEASSMVKPLRRWERAEKTHYRPLFPGAGPHPTAPSAVHPALLTTGADEGPDRTHGRKWVSYACCAGRRPCQSFPVLETVDLLQISEFPPTTPSWITHFSPSWPPKKNLITMKSKGCRGCEKL